MKSRESELEDARRKLTDLVAIRDDCERTAAQIAVAYAKAANAARTELEDAPLESRDPNPETAKLAASLAERLEAAREQLIAAKGAVVRQAQIVEEINGRIRAASRLRVLAAIKPHAKEATNLANRLGVLAAKITGTFARADLYPSDQPRSGPRIRASGWSVIVEEPEAAHRSIRVWADLSAG